MFTTLVPRHGQATPQAEQKATIQSSVIRALAALRPHVALVVFTRDPDIAREVRDLGAAAVMEGFRTAPFGVPLLRDMYAWVRQHSQSPMYGFMNADILFGPDLVDAVDVVLRGVANGTLGRRVLVTGRRFNVQMPLPFEDGHAWSVPEGASALDVSRIHYSMRAAAKPFIPGALDFFFITRGTWNWSAIPDFAPGRSMYDTWLSDHSYRDLVPRVEISRCVWPLHLSGSDGHFNGRRADLPHDDFNERQVKTRVGFVFMGSMRLAEWRLEAGGASRACQLLKAPDTLPWSMAPRQEAASRRSHASSATPTSAPLHLRQDTLSGTNRTKPLTTSDENFPGHAVQVMVLTHKRLPGLQRLLQSLKNADYSGLPPHHLRICVDRLPGGHANSTILSALEGFVWPHGIFEVGVQRKHQGLAKQWLTCWEGSSLQHQGGQLMDDSVATIGMVLEDDMVVSRHWARWIQGAAVAYESSKSIRSFTLQRPQLRASDGGNIAENIPFGATVVGYRLPGSWGFGVFRNTWRDFVKWQRRAAEADQDPSLPGLVLTDWWRTFKRQGTTDSMWTMWFAKFAQDKNLFTLYGSLGGNLGWAANYRDPGEHYHGKSQGPDSILVPFWRSELGQFPTKPILLGWDGAQVIDSP